MENPIKMDDLGVPLFSETSILLPAICTPHPIAPGGGLHSQVTEDLKMNKKEHQRQGAPCHPLQVGSHNSTYRGEKAAVIYQFVLCIL